MSYRVNPEIKKDLVQFGLNEWNECYHCGNCTAICPLTEDNHLFPRKSIRTLQMGLKDKLAADVDPWMCYYCGECTDTCPRDANPGELMMALRRYLTSLYDWTGLSRKFYTSKTWELAAILILAVFVVLLFVIFRAPMPTELTADGGVKINEFAPIKWIHMGDLIMAGIIGFLLISNIFRMHYMVVTKDKSTKIPLHLYITEFWHLIFHFGSQWKFKKCDDKKYWGFHWMLMSGYTIMFIMIVAFLPWFQTEEVHPIYHPQRLLGYYATFGLFAGLAWVVVGRIRKSETKFKFSHISDWLFLIMLFLTVLTGILLHFFRIFGLPMATYIMYVVHLAVLVPMLMVEVPFSKWSHLAYRPFAIYFSNLKKAAVALQEKKKTVFATA